MGTVRYLNADYHDPVAVKMKAIIDSVAAAHGVTDL
jgi:hypothetical protein